MKILQTCSACPSQWELVFPDGTHGYVRYRHGMLSVGFGATPDDAVMDQTYEVDPGFPADGVCSWSDVLPHVTFAMSAYCMRP